MKPKKIVPFVLAASVLGLAGCAPLAVNNTNGSLNLNFKPSSQQDSNTGKTLAMLKPNVTMNVGNTISDQVQENLYNNYLMNSSYHLYSITDHFQRSYEQPLINNIESGLASIYSHKGFKQFDVSGLDALTYSQKKESYLAPQTNINLNIFPKITSSTCNTELSYCTLKGDIQIGGKMLINYIEPLTQQIIYNQNINLSDFNISVPFTEQFTYQSGKQNIVAMAGSIMNSFSSKKVTLTDDTDKALTTALNTFYRDAMAKADKMISQKQILSYEDTVEGLKAKKVF